jgi:hypothetical protein
MEKIDVLVGCEESGTVTKQFRLLGINAWSCDIMETSGELSQYHIKNDLFKVINEHPEIKMGIFFPPCTYLTIAANKWLKDQPERKSGALVGQKRREAQKEAIEFFMRLYNLDIKHIVIENPIGIMSTKFRKPDQVLQPWMFGHGETKATCLWLKNLPLLVPTNIVEGREQKMFNLKKTDDRAKLRSKTYKGIARALAEQYSKYIIKTNE